MNKDELKFDAIVYPEDNFESERYFIVFSNDQSNPVTWCRRGAFVEVTLKPKMDQQPTPHK